MKRILLPAFYAAPIQYFALLQQDSEILIEKHENFVKSTWRNRALISGPNGTLMLTIPIKGGKGKKRKFSETDIDNNQAWQQLHWQSLCSSYRRSPYFEYYEDDLLVFYKNSYDKLFEFNNLYLDLLLQFLQIDIDLKFTNIYDARFEGDDYRNSFKGREQQQNPEYTQLFGARNGFQPGLSILDLIFHLGPETSTYLKTIVLEENIII